MSTMRWARLAAILAVVAALAFSAGWLAAGRSAGATHAAAAALTPEPRPTDPQPAQETPLPREQAPVQGDARSFRLLSEAWDKVRESFVGTVPSDTARNYAAIRGMLGALDDRYSVLIEPQPRAMERDQLRGQFGGIGATLRTDDMGRIMLLPSRGSPADTAGVRVGDILLAVDGVALPERPDINQTVLRVRGEPGSQVKITVLRSEAADAKILDFTIIREIIQLPSVEARVITRTGATASVGYLGVRQFTERTGLELKTAIGELRSQGVAEFVLDLRDNGGGLLSSAVEVSSQFIEQGVVVQERRRGDRSSTLNAAGGGLATRSPVVVLVNSGTASASEIVAGALRDWHRAKLVGEKTFGKGSVQYVYDLTDGSSIHVTAAKWLTPKGTTIDGVGLTPDIVVTRADGELSRGVDSQLDRALEVLRNAR